MRIELAENKVLTPSSSKKKTSFMEKELLSFSRFTHKKKEAFYREFALLLKSGVDFNKALELLIAQEKSKASITLYSSLLRQVIKGKSLSESMGNQNVFSDYEVYSINAGENIRKLPEVLEELQVYFERKIKIKRQIISIIAYPSFVLALTLGVLYFMLNYVVPMFSNIFKQFGSELPLITQYVVAFSSRFNTLLLIFGGVIILLAFVHKRFKVKEGYRQFIGALLLKTPILGRHMKRIAVAQFCQAMALLLSAKTSLPEALELTARLVNFYPLKKALLRSRQLVIKGIPLHESLQGSLFDTKLITMVTIGEEVNELDTMFNKLSKQLNDEIEYASKMIGSIIEPVMILVIAVIVGFILIAMYYPMFSLSQVIGN